MKKSFFIALLAVVTIAFSSCTQVTENYLVGKWQFVDVTGQAIYDGQLKESYYENVRDENEFVEFFADGTVSGDLWEGKYSLSEKGDKLILIERGSDYIWEHAVTIERVSQKRFEIIYSHVDEEDWDIYYNNEILGFERVK